MSRTLLLCAVLAIGSFKSVAAQEVPVSLGDRVRVWTEVSEKGRPTGPRRIAQITAYTTDSLVMDPAGAEGPLAIPLTSISRMDVSLGQRSRGTGALRGGSLGLIIGGVTGIALGFASGDDDSFLFNRWQDKAFILGVMLGTASTLVGAIIGANRPGERWKRVLVPGRVSISPSGRTSVAASASLSGYSGDWALDDVAEC